MYVRGIWAPRQLSCLTVARSTRLTVTAFVAVPGVFADPGPTTMASAGTGPGPEAAHPGLDNEDEPLHPDDAVPPVTPS